MSWDWGIWLVVDAALLVAATVVTLILFARDLLRGMRSRPGRNEERPH